ncbi:RNA polymerase subunit sigma-70 [Corynebacterium sp. CCUG 18816]|uniref:sugar-binding transcriptional regulator n=1 Tax=Corynebacterium pseudogenitalium TaxID=38303 RepID=UPI00210B6DE8|nr:sugar-binding domain-containing protein [Corynebacterium pseudogenitalium]MCQ4617393.1 RNA polymerase subunit sigma-70 [Corynebacterium pseudogenitalium]
MDTRDRDALTAAKLYYRSELSQAEVAAEMGCSRPTVAKLLQHAKDRGYVTIEVHDPQEADEILIEDLTSRYTLEGVRIVHPANPSAAIMEDLGVAGARYLESMPLDGLSVGVSWGKTLLNIARNLRPTNMRARQIVQLKGGSSRSHLATNDFETITGFCTAFNAPALTLPLPVIFERVETKEIVEQDSHIADVLQQGRETDVAVFTVGSVRKQSLLMNLGYLSEEMSRELLGVAVGDACSRFYTREGDVASKRIDDLTVGIELDELRARPRRVLVAGGLYKAEAIETALWMGLASDLVIDQPTAVRVLEIAKTR